ncbi:uncharacterized protein DNG_06615 [Cephalotrichum gorgonifer]|uniref:DUF3128 domain-containing protein n=1 Tax=Cephalotrichum gorgonifer TaxID=2041049 RepID=A0AAE8SXG8_9PEZI|nr:uncharacterized protein DNG_06615 [Cephalotrichum gorgonifer]
MGWLWASPSSERPRQTPPASQSPPAPTPPKQTADEHDADELKKFLMELQADFNAKPNTPAPKAGLTQPVLQQPTTTTTTTSSSSSTPSTAFSLSSWLPFLAVKSAKPEEGPLPTSTSRTATPTTEALAHSLRPTSMSCRQAFDLAYACQSIGGQFTSVYRDGALRSCSHLWDDFWFCMRTKSYTGPVKDEMVREHYRKKELLKYGGKPNSEDVWESRESMVEPGTVFREPLVEEVLSDDEWQLMEIERRKQIRRELGYE